MDPEFVRARKDGAWQVASRTLSGTCAGVDITGERRWWGGRWALTSAAPFPVPETLILFVSVSGMEHGFWRDLLVGDPGFDRSHFIFCDTPALLPLVLGPATRQALRDSEEIRDALTLYVRGGVTRVMGTSSEDDPRAIDRHLAVHHALAEDHRACLASWQELMTSSHGRADATWPPGIAGTHQLGSRHVTIFGVPSISIPVLDDLVHMGNIVAIRAGAEVAVALRGLAAPRQMNAGLRIIELIVDPEGTGSPYR